MIRKAWELGTDEVVIQTTVQIDGDVVTRIYSDYTERDLVELMKLHEMSVNTSIRSWKNLLDTVNAFFTGVLGVIFRSGSASPGAKPPGSQTE